MIRRRSILPLLVSSALLGQGPNAFDVASMKPTDPALVRVTPLRLDTLPGGRFVVRNVALRVLVAFAFDVRDQNVSGAPSWFENTYDIDAVTAGVGEMSAEELRPGVMSLLQDRMKLAAHREQRQVTIYALTVAPGGLKLKPSASQAPPAGGFSQRTRMSLRNATMKYIAGTLSRHPDIHAKVIDKTGVSGQFDLELDWRSVTASANPAPGGDAPDSIFSLVQQLGLRLTPEKGSEDFLVIDHAEHPSPD
jgi:uncharacterized protein (TIGR03435 family)